jgi:hypothetical protein
MMGGHDVEPAAEGLGWQNHIRIWSTDTPSQSGPALGHDALMDIQRYDLR